MKTIQVTVNESLLRHVDQVISSLKTTRSAFIRDLLKEGIAKFRSKRLEAQHRKGYIKKSSRDDEWQDWEAEQAWGDE